MATKHFEDGCEINGFVDDAGQMVSICSCCGAIWQGSLEPAKEADAASREHIVAMIDRNPSVFAESQIDIDAVVDDLRDN